MALYLAKEKVLTALRQRRTGGPRSGTEGCEEKHHFWELASELKYSPKKGSRYRTRSRIVSFKSLLYL